MNKLKTTYYITKSNGVKRVYSFADRHRGYNSTVIPALNQLLLVNFYINGVLQPNIIYSIQKGKLIIKSRDVPPIGTPMMLQFISYKPKSRCKYKKIIKKNTKKRERTSMPVPYLKLYLTATNTVVGSVDVTTTTDVDAAVSRYSATVIVGMIAGGITTIPATAFIDDSGNPVDAGSLTVPTDGFYNVYINGVLQLADLSSLTSDNLVINASVVLGVAVVLQTEDFAGTMSLSTSTNNITVSTTIDT
ncbi:DUF4183 domain-containing protein [Paenibacillus agricola]|uniref:DUF4183 domain-containing protein n=1 Tax=Paenibacillus agricola TaxID=2716264 RepID=A0ABX0J6D0_9BACL|nr:DUF4183 domain-containing protein [Paenibacillus agricola]NHN31697.1 DUF4183 domain-containing protein [Paenibacillus agricola]